MLNLPDIERLEVLKVQGRIATFVQVKDSPLYIYFDVNGADNFEAIKYKTPNMELKVEGDRLKCFSLNSNFATVFDEEASSDEQWWMDR